ncbi:P63C domain-containing protein [Granulicella paludicola]|uniref:P63C domain-containing protein n=1 Tax=Granulicella paludicola TaxID=474951 RepID=UPI0021E049C0|nr:P63C domain-containing protein [Granulicella paludicola]
MSEEAKGSAGGLARAEVLSPAKRTEIAKRAASARWGNADLPQAVNEGTLKIGDLEIPCAVLDGERRVVNESNFMSALGMYRSGALSVRRKEAENGGAHIPLFLAHKNLKPYIERHLGSVHYKPERYKTLTGGTAIAITGELIPKICEIWMDAARDGVLGKRQLITAAKAEIMLRSLAHIGIVALIDEATGYQAVRPQNALQAYLEKIVAKELAAWAKKFPDEFYENIYKLKNWPWPGMKKNRYSVVAYYTRDLVYQRIAPSLLEELEKKSPKDDKGNRKNKLHQWLTEDIGDPLLAQHMHSLIMFQRLAIASGFGWNRFVKMVDQVMPKRGNTLELPFPDGNSFVPALPEN